MTDSVSYEAAAHEASALPVMLPTRLVGREAALAQVYARLKEGRPVHVYGASGIGKTALAATLASAYAQQPGGVLWFNVDNDPLESLLVRVGRAYDINELTTTDNPMALVGAVAATLTQHKPLLVLDGEIDAQVASKFITRCADRLPVIIATEEALDGPWENVELDVLQLEAGVALFKQEAAITTNDQDDAIRDLTGLLEDMPYGIGVAARAMLASKQTPNAYHTLLENVATTTNDDGVLAALAASFGALNGALQGVLLIMGATFKGQASAELLSLVSGAPVESVHQAMNILAQLRLVEKFNRYGAPYYHLHPITYDFTHSRLRQSDRLDGLQQKFKEAILAYITTNANNYDKLAVEMENYLALAQWAEAKQQRDVTAQMLSALLNTGGFITERGFVYELGRIRAASVGRNTAFPAYPQDVSIAPPEDELEADSIDLEALLRDDEDDEFDDYDADEDFDTIEDDEDEPAPLTSPEDMLNALVDDAAEDVPMSIASVIDVAASGAAVIGADFDDDDDEEDGLVRIAAPYTADESELLTPAIDDIAGLRAAIAQARQRGDRPRQVELLRAMGKQQLAEGMNNEAIATYNEALNVYESLDDGAGVLEMLDMLAALMLKTGNLQAAILNAGRGVRVAESLGEKETQLQLLLTLGDARQQLGESDEAATIYSQALAIARNTNDSQHEAVTLYKLGYAQLDGGEPETAIETWEQALQRFRNQNRRDYEGRVLGGLGSAYGEVDRWAEAIKFHTSALYIAREVNDREEEALQLISLGYAALQADQLGDALLRYRQALHLAYQSGKRDDIVGTIVDLSKLLLRSPRHLTVVELLITDAMKYEPTDKDVRQLNERVTTEKAAAQASGTEFIDVHGSAEQYAANAYRLLNE